MEITIFTHNYSNVAIDQFEEIMLDAELKFFASDMLSYGFNVKEIDNAIERAIQTCQTAAVPIRNNFKSIYLSNNKEILCDWKLSDFGRKLAIMNASPTIPLVAQLQIELLKKDSQ